MEPYTILTIYLLLPSTIFYFTIRRYLPSKNQSHLSTHPTVHKYTLASECRTIIRGSELTTGPRNRLTPRQARAGENQDLRRVFGVHNALTCVDEDQIRVFVEGVSGKMRISNREWSNLGHVLRHVVWEVVQEIAVGDGIESQDEDAGQGEVRVNLVLLVQALSLKLLLWVLFDMHSPIQAKHLIALAKVIHEICTDMKNGNPVPPFKQNESLHAALAAVFPRQHHITHNPTTNPLNWILPCYANLWRCALSTFTETKNHSEYTKILMAFAGKPTHARFEQMYAIFNTAIDIDSFVHVRTGKEASIDSTSASVSVSYIILESLRLHPPTPHISRTYHITKPASPSPSADPIPTTSDSTFKDLISLTATASMQSCHLSPSTWGADVNEFKPFRWTKLSPVQGLSFLAFGARPGLCPAAREFGGRAAALVVGVLGSEISNGWELEGGLDGDNGLGLELVKREE
ncbi:hypothetical protein BJY04DRAFT_220058 [Aspergillus karnatakaensis]|uniref:uncharacterized protein n=1 Tax=Aspergillus karnatakaensis TaxID=1810916 RepID=UPI003CCD8416